ncbi:hypothetical protein [Streptomyces sp. NPDC007088]|uniref:hypothetical protein n=1 Tax=Streptomyces sp. NPDC007088 TaxID=3364773 RepID=UPI0036D02532
MRLLPWTGEGGKDCYLISVGDAEADSVVSRLADSVEAIQLTMAQELLDHVRSALREGATSETELLFYVTHLSSALRDALRVAESRGGRLQVSGATSEAS